MCSTCGCGNDSEVKYLKPGQEANGHHHHDHHHHHAHGNDHHHHHDHKLQNQVVDLEAEILGENNRLAERNRGYFDALNILAVNLVSSPGSGKTTLLEKTIKSLGNETEISVIEGDQQTTRDALRIEQAGAKSLQITTGKACHLDAHMITHAVKELKPASESILFIENVGNLVCPAMFDLGESKRVVIISTTEGEDKPLKYPYMFEGSDLCIINKSDLLPYLDLDIEALKEYALRINPKIEFMVLSAKSEEGMKPWLDWVKARRESIII